VGRARLCNRATRTGQKEALEGDRETTDQRACAITHMATLGMGNESRSKGCLRSVLTQTRTAVLCNGQADGADDRADGGTLHSADTSHMVGLSASLHTSDTRPP